MLRAWNLIGRSGGKFPTPFMQDPVILIILIFLVILGFFTPYWWAMLVGAGIGLFINTKKK